MARLRLASSSPALAMHHVPEMAARCFGRAVAVSSNPWVETHVSSPDASDVPSGRELEVGKSRLAPRSGTAGQIITARARMSSVKGRYDWRDERAMIVAAGRTGANLR
nr:hypothetical protein BDOA9_0153490 [Bradyrhizobium sp. DOA9]